MLPKYKISNRENYLTTDSVGAIIMGENEGYFHPTCSNCISLAKLCNDHSMFSLLSVTASKILKIDNLP